MAPAQVFNTPQTPFGYCHKKFHARLYSHKKFGSRCTSPLELSQPPIFITENQRNLSAATIINKRSTGAIFRPYALEDNVKSQKRKHQEIQDEGWQQEHSDFVDAKIFAYSPSSPSPPPPDSPPPLVSPPLASPPPPSTTPIIPDFSSPTPVDYHPYMPQPFYIQEQQQYQFNAQAFSILLQTQHAALCVGAILKSQQNFDIHNVIGN